MIGFIIHVLIIDTGSAYLPQYKPYVSSTVEDKHGHGTSVTSLVLFGANLKDKPCRNVAVDVCEGLGNKLPVECLSKAPTGYYDYINISGGGAGLDAIEAAHVARLSQGGSIIIAAAGNDNKALSSKQPYYPASYQHEGYINIRAVGNGSNAEHKAPSSNYGPNLIWIDGEKVTAYNSQGQIVTNSGTSMSAALLTHNYIMRRCYEIDLNSTTTQPYRLRR